MDQLNVCYSLQVWCSSHVIAAVFVNNSYQNCFLQILISTATTFTYAICTAYAISELFIQTIQTTALKVCIILAALVLLMGATLMVIYYSSLLMKEVMFQHRSYFDYEIRSYAVSFILSECAECQDKIVFTSICIELHNAINSYIFSLFHSFVGEKNSPGRTRYNQPLPPFRHYQIGENISFIIYW